MSYVDLHCHILPGLDDGAATMEETLRHARRLHAEGVRDVACTPHIKRDHYPDIDPAQLRILREEAQRAIAAEGLGVRLHPGGELAHDDALILPPHQLHHIAQGPAGARWLLLECPFAGIDDDFIAAAERLTSLGFGLLLAHPERAADGHEHLWPLLEQGALLQVNVCSLLGRQGPEAHAGAIKLVREGLAYVLGSDGHGGNRAHTLAAGTFAARAAGASREYSRRLTQDNPRFLLERGIPALDADAPRAHVQ
jgi:protein-tyrosine phosphatase